MNNSQMKPGTRPLHYYSVFPTPETRVIRMSYLPLCMQSLVTVITQVLLITSLYEVSFLDVKSLSTGFTSQISSEGSSSLLTLLQTSSSRSKILVSCPLMVNVSVCLSSPPRFPSTPVLYPSLVSSQFRPLPPPHRFLISSGLQLSRSQLRSQPPPPLLYVFSTPRTLGTIPPTRNGNVILHCVDLTRSSSSRLPQGVSCRVEEAYRIVGLLNQPSFNVT